MGNEVKLGMSGLIKLEHLATVDLALGKEAGYSANFQPAMKKEGGQWVPDPGTNDLALSFDSAEAAMAASNKLKSDYAIGGQGKGGYEANIAKSL